MSYKIVIPPEYISDVKAFFSNGKPDLEAVASVGDDSRILVEYVHNRWAEPSFRLDKDSGRLNSSLVGDSYLEGRVTQIEGGFRISFDMPDGDCVEQEYKL